MAFRYIEKVLGLATAIISDQSTAFSIALLRSILSKSILLPFYLCWVRLRMELITILIWFFLCCIPFVISSLYILSWLTPWPKRTHKEFLEPKYLYNPSNSCSESKQFKSLLVLDESSGRFYCREPDLYLSVIIPAMNEQERLPVMLDECLPYLEDRQAKNNFFTYEVIIVDDGSTDGTANIGCKYGQQYGEKIKVLKLEKNLGKGGAVRMGVLCARGSLILFADADGATNFADFQLLENELLIITAFDGDISDRKNFNWEFPAIAVGSRAHMEKESIAKRSLVRTLLMIGFHIIVYIFTVRTIHDTQCGYKLFTRGAVAKLFPLLHIERWAFDVELLFLAEYFDIPVREIPVRWHEVDGSKIVPILSWVEMGRDLILIWFRYKIGIWNYDSILNPGSRRKVDQDARNKLLIESERVLNTYDANSDIGDYIDSTWDIQTYLSNIKLMIINESVDGMSLEFDLVGVEAPIANAIRRILIAEIPTMAIEKVYLYQNTSVLPDEVLCHRLGLLPIKADPRHFKMPLTRVIGINEFGVDCDEEPTGDQERNLIFQIKVSCTRNRNASKTATNPKEIYKNAFVYSDAFKWIPIGNQASLWSHPPAMVHDDILITQLRPGQEIEARCHCVKGIGRDHAKFSPVATASYRLLPQISLTKDFTGEDAQKIKDSFSDGVIGINKDGIAYVKDARYDTCSRNILRHEDLAEHIELSKIKNHFIFSVESTGALKSAELVAEACKVMESKCKTIKFLFKKKLNELLSVSK
ncbi:unnamed protein product [Thelazia callipaeda]|uniref:DNA-directed RNA polymerases I and III subunit RPAC1 n=1 Tax=Thelazia callipaeda TaxID=103827 RepID=A0A0N5D714_THECL|nr:unnamed protein product [Thelazia callipaeda]